ncbi:MAG TPA: sporulation protein YtfJ [Firmicutes bacterium]|nr:sporulation protein YtfJ [Bacillota bacterium]
MAEHPIQGLMKTAMESIKDMVDVNTVVGDPVETPDGSVIIPVSRVSLGFAAGGGEYEARAAAGTQGGEGGAALPFGGGSGAGVSVQPVAFVVVGGGQVRLLPVDSRALYDRLIDLAPEILERLESLMSGREGNKGTRGGEEEGENRPARPRYRGNDHEPPPEYNPQGRR